jgi:exodeoxyribonuclease V alpha subunit
MTLTLAKLIEDDALAPIHTALGTFIQRAAPESGDPVALAAAVLSDQIRRGHVCLDLKTASQIDFAGHGQGDASKTYDHWPATDDWIDELKTSEAVEVLDASDSAGSLRRPLVLDAEHQLLYLSRYWYHQQQLAINIAGRLAEAPIHVDETKLAADIQTLFPDREKDWGRDQCLAAANAVDQRFSIITGGPGTGKTTTVAKLLALRLMNNATTATDDALEILLLAPTGKAAQRLNESMGRVADALSISDALKTQLKAVKAGTIHRALGWTPLPPERGGPFTHHGGFPLEADVVLVDEASMVDLALMQRLFDAIPMHAQVILMGDRDQLASVEAGGVLADLCGDAALLDVSKMSGSRRQVLAERSGLSMDDDAETDPSPVLADQVFHLRYSHRFQAEGALGRLAAAVRAGDADQALGVLKANQGQAMQWLQSTNPKQVVDAAVEAAKAYQDQLDHEQKDPLALIKAMNRFRVLCAHQSGPMGATNINTSVAREHQSQTAARTTDTLYAGCPIMVTVNDYAQRLFNGDVGIIVQRDGEPFALFEDAAEPDGVRLIPRAMLPAARPCHAMTIHKSQGSEFNQVLVSLPQHVSPVLTRELLYTAITRVADTTDPVTNQPIPGELTLVADESVLRATIESRIRRASGLRNALTRISSKTTD